MTPKAKTLVVRCFLLPFLWTIVASQHTSREYSGRKAIIYQGSTFLVSGGCKLPQCDTKLQECQRIRNAFQNLYSFCTQSFHGNYPACLRNKVDPTTSINVPIYASVCDALCHESDPEKLQALTVCESQAERDEELSNHFDN